MRKNEGKGEPIYVLEVSDYWVSLNSVSRIVYTARSDGSNIVRKDRAWVQLYSTERLKQEIQHEIIEFGKNLLVDGRQTSPDAVELRQFVKEGDRSLGRYKTFSEGGF